jgi:hypothetical protein
VEEGPAALYLQREESTRELTDFGSVASYNYASRFAWFQP